MRNRTGWQYALAGLFIASIAAVISYNDGLFVARLAGNHDRQAFLYPLLPDGLIVVCLLALVEGARARPPQRSGWATGGLVLGIGMTLSMNAGAGVAHSVLDAVIDGLVPVVFFIAVEVVLWHVKRGRGAAAAPGDSPGSPAARPVTAGVTARVTVPPVREIQARRGCGPATARKVQAELRLFARSFDPPAGSRDTLPAGASGRGAGHSIPPSAPAALNGSPR